MIIIYIISPNLTVTSSLLQNFKDLSAKTNSMPHSRTQVLQMINEVSIATDDLEITADKWQNKFKH